MHQQPRKWTHEKKEKDKRKQKIMQKKQRTSRITKIITARSTVYVWVHVWHYLHMSVSVYVCIWMSVCICMCTNTCTASATGKPALAVKTLPLSVIQTYFLLFYFDFNLTVFDHHSISRTATPLPLVSNSTSHIPSHLSPQATLYKVLRNIYLSTMLWC